MLYFLLKREKNSQYKNKDLFFIIFRMIDLYWLQIRFMDHFKLRKQNILNYMTIAVAVVGLIGICPICLLDVLCVDVESTSIVGVSVFVTPKNGVRFDIGNYSYSLF